MTGKVNDSMRTLGYELACTDCSFETTIEGNFIEALDVADSHQEENGGPPVDHFVNIERAVTDNSESR